VLKFFYLAKRHPSLTPDAFVARWRRHGAMTTARPSWENMRVYVQADTLRPAPARGFSVAYDGFCYGIPSDNFSPPREENADLESLAQDELQIFEGPIKPRMISVEPETLIDGGFGFAAWLAFDDESEAEIVAATFARQGALERVVLNHVKRDLSPGVSVVDCHAIVEVCAKDEARLGAALRQDNARRWRNARLSIVAQENLLWDRRRA
jgi:hypothetical protein